MSYIRTIIQGRNNYPPYVRKVLQEVGDKPIKSLSISRAPIRKAITTILNLLTLGELNRSLDQLSYDELFHLRLIAIVEDKTVLIEKNEVINIEYVKGYIEGETKKVDFPGTITINQLLEGAKKIQGDNFFKYSAYDNNCQDFVTALLKGSNIGTQQDFNFIKQDTKQLFENYGYMRKITDTVTNVGAKINEVIYGAGLGSVVQSILFDNDKWTKRKAVAWLKKHDYTGLDVDEKENTLRYRQVEPDEKNKYITKDIGNGIQLVIMYPHKQKPSKSSNMKKYNSISPKYNSMSKDKTIIRALGKLQKQFEDNSKLPGLEVVDAYTMLGGAIKECVGRGIELLSGPSEGYTSKEPMKEYRPSTRMLRSQNPLLDKISTEDIKALSTLTKQSKELDKDAKVLEETAKATRTRVARDIKNLKTTSVKSSVAKATTKAKRGRMVKGSPEAKQWALMMAERRRSKKK